MNRERARGSREVCSVTSGTGSRLYNAEAVGIEHLPRGPQGGSTLNILPDGKRVILRLIERVECVL